MTISTQYWSNH